MTFNYIPDPPFWTEAVLYGGLGIVSMAFLVADRLEEFKQVKAARAHREPPLPITKHRAEVVSFGFDFSNREGVDRYSSAWKPFRLALATEDGQRFEFQLEEHYAHHIFLRQRGTLHLRGDDFVSFHTDS